MNLKKQHIGRLFTILASLIILAHAVVPHHHHFELLHSAEEKSTCENSAQKKNTENPDSHCHAFNVLVSEKTSYSSVNQSLSEHFSFYFPGIIANIQIPPVKNLITPIFEPQNIFLKQFLSTAQSLRAPPVIA